MLGRPPSSDIWRQFLEINQRMVPVVTVRQLFGEPRFVFYDHPMRRQAFTLIESMIVVGIIGVLAAIAIPAFNGYVRKSKESEATMMLDEFHKGYAAYWHMEHTTQGLSGAIQKYCVPTNDFPITGIPNVATREPDMKVFADFTSTVCGKILGLKDGPVWWSYGIANNGGCYGSSMDTANNDTLASYIAVYKYDTTKHRVLLGTSGVIGEELARAPGLRRYPDLTVAGAAGVLMAGLAEDN